MNCPRCHQPMTSERVSREVKPDATRQDPHPRPVTQGGTRYTCMQQGCVRYQGQSIVWDE